MIAMEDLCYEIGAVSKILQHKLPFLGVEGKWEVEKEGRARLSLANSKALESEPRAFMRFFKNHSASLGKESWT